MPVTLTDNANERSTYAVDVSFFDEDDVAVTPTSITWTLSDVQGNVINSREDVAVAVPAATITIVLSGLDLVLDNTYVSNIRKILIKATYTSTLGSGLPLRDEITFEINDFSAQTGIV